MVISAPLAPLGHGCVFINDHYNNRVVKYVLVINYSWLIVKSSRKIIFVIRKPGHSTTLYFVLVRV